LFTFLFLSSRSGLSRSGFSSKDKWIHFKILLHLPTFRCQNQNINCLVCLPCPALWRISVWLPAVARLWIQTRISFSSPPGMMLYVLLETQSRNVLHYGTQHQTSKLGRRFSSFEKLVIVVESDIATAIFGGCQLI